MKRGINLKLTEKKIAGVSRKILFGTIILFTIIAVIAVLLISVRLYYDFSLKAVNEKEKELTAAILKHNTKKDKLSDLHTRLSNIKSIIDKRENTMGKMTTVSDIIPPVLPIILASSEKKSVAYTISSPDLNSINDLLEKKVYELAADKQKSVERIELLSFGLNPLKGEYDLNFNVTFK